METLLILFIFLVSMYTAMALIKSFTKYGLYQSRLEQIKGISGPHKQNDADLKSSLNSLITSFSKFIAPKSVADNVQNDLNKAGIPLKSHEYLFACFVIILVLPIILYITTHNIGLAIITIIAGLMAPRIYIARKKDARIQAFNQQLGDSLVIMANALRAGFGFQQAMDAVRKEMPHPISTEFNWSLREMNLGFSQEEALNNLGKRVGSDDLDMVITGINIQRQVGGNLAEILENISFTIRERDKVKREIKVLTAQGRMSGMVIGTLPILLAGFMLVANPGYFGVMFTQTVGIIMLGVAGVMEILGMLIIKNMVNFEY